VTTHFRQANSDLDLSVCHIATATVGGAGIAAFRAHESLKLIGVKSNFLTPSRKLLDKQHSINETFLSLKSKSLTLGQRMFIQKESGRLVTPFSLNFMQGFQNNDSLIHLHAFYNLFNMKKLLEVSRERKMVFTLHDERLFTGGCHYSNGCKGYVDSCKKCPQTFRAAWPTVERVKKLSRELLKQPNIGLVCPSGWIRDQLLQAQTIDESRVQVIRNPIPHEDVLTPGSEIRASLGISASKMTIGFISSSLLNPLKGLNILMRAIESSGRLQRKVHLILVGNGRLSSTSKDLGITFSEQHPNYSVSDFIRAMDFLVVPSLEDNLPNVLGESLMNGTPVIGSKVGGIPEILDNFNLPTINAGSVKELQAALSSINLEVNREEIKERARQTFGYSAIGTQLHHFYTKVLGNS
jgi:glycosyltransferase involved in cell wall biosynthesis